MLSPGETPVNQCTLVPVASTEHSGLRCRTRVTCPRSKRTKTNRLSEVRPVASLSGAEYRFPGISRAQSEQQSEFESGPGFIAAEMAYPAQTFVSVDLAMSPIADNSDPFKACCIKSPFTI